MRKLMMVCSVLLVLFLGVGLVVAQDTAECDEAWGDVVTTAAANCAGLSAGMVCTGAGSVALTLQNGEAASPALLSPQDGIAQINTVGMPAGISQLWVPGVGEGERLFAVLFGAAQLANVSGPPRGPVCNSTSLGSVNVRTEPNTEATILGQLEVSQSAPIVARLADSTWWRILWGDEPAWIFAELAPADCDPAQMLVFDPVTEEVSGGLAAPAFQNGYLENSFMAAACPDEPRGGLLLQSEAGGASWRINNILLNLAGTVLLQASPQDVLVAYVYEGQISLEVNGLSRVAQAGQLLRVPLQNGSVSAMPGPAVDMTPVDAVTAPVTLLPRAVALPATNDDLAISGDQVVCAAVSQQVILDEPLVVTANAGQTMRVSAAASTITDVTGHGPDGQLLPVSGEPYAASNGQAFVADVVAETDGMYTFAVESGSEPVQWGLTCDLPQTPPLPQVQACSDVLLSWPAVTGNMVRFTAPFGAAVSVQAAHSLPSQGVAQTLAVQMASGEAVGQMPFIGFVAEQVAGPFEFVAPRETEYHVLWDGDPFNEVDVEVLCLPPAAGEQGVTD